MDAEAKQASLLRWIDETERTVTALAPTAAEGLWLDLIFRIQALLDPCGSLGDEVARLYGLVSSGDHVNEIRESFAAIVAAPRDVVMANLAKPSDRKRAALYPTVLQQDYLASDEPPAEALAMSLYAPLDLLAHYDVPASLRELLLLPVQAADPAFFDRAAPPDAIAVDAAIHQARADFASLDLSSKRLDFSSPLAFAMSFNAELQNQTLDTSTPRARPNPRHADAPEPDWSAIVETIIEGARRAIAAWSKRYGSAYAFMLEADPPAGYVLFSVETAAHHATVRRGAERHEEKRRAQALTGPHAWKEARNLLAPTLDDLFNPGDFAEQDFCRVDVGEVLQRFAESERCPAASQGSEGYVAARMRLCLWNAIEKLVGANAFAPIVDTPLAVGYAFHEERPIILHIVEGRAKRRR
jgi:hypothetical protein